VASYDALYTLPATRLRAFRVGRLAILQDGRPTGLGIPILAYAIDAPGGVFVIDTGLSPRWAETSEVHLGPDDSPSPGTPYSPELDGPPLVDQLANLGIRPDRLVCTHLHEDHAGGAAALGLTLEASAAELARLADDGAAADGYPVDDLRRVPTRALELDPSRPLGPFPASLELAQGVIAVDTSGHTPGSISVLACIGPAWALVCGDAPYPRMDQPGSPAFEGALRLRRALDDHRGLRLFPAHDTVVLRSGAADGWLGPGPDIDEPE
jgi:glyoxylase-like metal-dependent hydrolase (beta-lactamase superfamily II)